MGVPLQYEEAAQWIGISPSGSRSHRPDGPKTGHALTFTLDHSKKANQGHRFRDMERRLRAAEVHVTSSEFKLNRDYRNL